MRILVLNFCLFFLGGEGEERERKTATNGHTPLRIWSDAKWNGNCSSSSVAGVTSREGETRAGRRRRRRRRREATRELFTQQKTPGEKGRKVWHSPILSKNISYTFAFNNEMKGFRTLSHGIIKDWCMSDFETEAPGLLE